MKRVTVNEVRLYCAVDAESGDDRWFFELPELGGLSNDEPYLTIDAACEGVKTFITGTVELAPEVYSDDE